MQLHLSTPVIQQLPNVAALALAAIAIVLAVSSEQDKRNADLVRIGISVLRVDPQKEKEISVATRKWALDLIDANAGVKFSPEARAQLLKEPLKSSGAGYDNFWGNSDLGPLPQLNSSEIPRK